MIIARMDIVREGGNASERPGEASAGSDEGEMRCIYYECREAQDPRERGPYEVAKGCVTIQVFKG